MRKPKAKSEQEFNALFGTQLLEINKIRRQISLQLRAKASPTNHPFSEKGKRHLHSWKPID